VKDAYFSLLLGLICSDRTKTVRMAPCFAMWVTDVTIVIICLLKSSFFVQKSHNSCVVHTGSVHRRKECRYAAYTPVAPFQYGYKTNFLPSLNKK